MYMDQRERTPGELSACVLGELLALSIRRQTKFDRAIRSVILTGIAALVLGTSVTPASAQNFFEALFGRLWNPNGVSAYADPNASGRNPEASRSEETSCRYPEADDGTPDRDE